MIVEILITLLIIFLVYASCNIRSNIYLKVFCKKQTEDKIVAITFDDGLTRYKPQSIASTQRTTNTGLFLLHRSQSRRE